MLFRSKESLPRPLVEEIEVAWFPLMNFLGYELQSQELDSKAMPVWVKAGQPL